MWHGNHSLFHKNNLIWHVWKAWEENEALNVNIKEIVKKVLEVLQIELKLLEKRIKDTPYDFLRDELSSTKTTIGKNVEDASSLLERDDIILQIDDLENQLVELVKRQEKGEFVDDLIKNNATTLDNLRKEEKELRKNRNNRFASSYLYDTVWLIRSEEKWTLKNANEMWFLDEHERDMRYLHDCFNKTFTFRQYNVNPPEIFWIRLNEENKDQNIVEIKKMIEYAIRCKNAKIFTEPTTSKTISLIVGAKSLDEAAETVVKDNILLEYYDGHLNDSFVGNPDEDFDFWINNKKKINSLKKLQKIRKI